MSKKNKTLKRIKTPSRRKFIKAAAATGAVAVAAASNLAAPAVAADRVEMAIVTTWPRDFP
ncbi:MAG: twin-arginine translocation signal domain-containing protein, partial [SAR324 cluster bacterium]|nr:twin-arginine translocation signal domain-containing protein [SAR324 cluster bacterium]